MVVSSVNPGFCVSDLGRNFPLAQRVFARVMGFILGRTPEQGARQLVWAALGPDGKEGPHLRQTMNGAYVSIAEVREPSDYAISKEGWEAQEKLWVSNFKVLLHRVYTDDNLIF